METPIYNLGDLLSITEFVSNIVFYECQLKKMSMTVKSQWGTAEPDMMHTGIYI